MQDYFSEKQLPSLQTAQSIAENILNKVCRQMFYQGYQSPKIFQKIVENKSDIQRIVRENHFISSLRVNKVEYQQPKISPIKANSPTKNKQCRQQQLELKEKARQFISKIRNKKKEMQGKFYLKKRAEQQRKKELQKKLQVQQMVYQQVQRNIRRLKAQKNIQFFQQKRMISLRQSPITSPYQRKLSQVTERIYENDNYQQIKLPKISPSKLQQIKEQDLNNIPIGLKKTVRKRSQPKQRKRAVTQTCQRPQTPMYESKQLKLLSIDKKKPRIRSIRQSTITQIQFDNNPDKKSYLMKRRNTQDISEYIRSNTNVEEIMMKQSKNYISCLLESEKQSPIKKNKLKKYATKSSLYSYELERQLTVNLGQQLEQQQQAFENQ